MGELSRLPGWQGRLSAWLREVNGRPIEHPLSWTDPPEGLSVRVHDPWIQPPHPLVDTPLSAPDRGLCPVEGGDCRIELSATFPWLPRGMAVRL